MIVYNISMKVSSEIQDEWLKWQKEEHIPEIMASGYFTEYKFFQLLEHDDPGSSTYIIQYYAPSFSEYEKYLKEIAPHLRKKTLSKWSNQFIAFRTVMKIVN